MRIGSIARSRAKSQAATEFAALRDSEARMRSMSEVERYMRISELLARGEARYFARAKLNDRPGSPEDLRRLRLPEELGRVHRSLNAEERVEFSHRYVQSLYSELASLGLTPQQESDALERWRASKRAIIEAIEGSEPVAASKQL